jgi:hypothetical protein
MLASTNTHTHVHKLFIELLNTMRRKSPVLSEREKDNPRESEKRIFMYMDN